MKTSDILVSACKDSVFPDTCALSDYGLDGCGATNSILVYNCYKNAITKDGVNSVQLHEALESNKLNELIMNSPSVKKSNILKNVEIKTVWDEDDHLRYLECESCSFVNNYEKLVCKCCGDSLPLIIKGFS